MKKKISILIIFLLSTFILSIFLTKNDTAYKKTNNFIKKNIPYSLKIKLKKVYTFINSLNGKFSANLNKFENDYWGTSIKELLVKSKKKGIFNNKKFYSIATCGLNTDIIKYYLNKDFMIEYKFVNTNEKYDYIIFINKIDTSSGNVNLKDNKTCYDQFYKNEIITIKRNGLRIAFISN